MKQFFDKKTKQKIEENNNILNFSKSNINNDISNANSNSIKMDNSVSFINQAKDIIEDIQNNMSSSSNKENSSVSESKDTNNNKTNKNIINTSLNNKEKKNINNKKKIKKRKKRKKSDSSNSSSSSSSSQSSSLSNSSSSESPKKNNIKKKNSLDLKQVQKDEQEEEIENLKIFEKKIVNKVIPFEKLNSKNNDHKFLMEINNKKKEDNGQFIQEIIKNFPNTSSIIKKYIEDISKEEKIEFFKNNGFILTQKSKERISLLIHYILTGNPILFEGNTGTAKTRTAIMAYKYIKEYINKDISLIRYNLSRETRIDDLISKYVGESKSFIGLKVKEGPFLDAYINGKILLLDEINLAPTKVLQCIQQALDNRYISVEANGKGLIRHDMHENFCLIATQNPNKGGFVGKRQELEKEFLSRFQKIYFNEIEIDEMKEIAIGIAKNIGYIKQNENQNENKYELINDIVELHYKWSKENQSENDVQCFTIREIETVIEALNEDCNKFDILMTVYGGRYFKEKKEKLLQEFKNYNNLKNLTNSNNELDENFPNCFRNKSLIETTKSVILSLKNKRNILIVGNSENGLTQLAKWCSIYYNKIKKKEENNEEKDKNYICYCTKNLERKDLIGSQKLSSEYKTELKFNKGILYKAIEKGYSIVLDNINEAPSRVIEKLNDLLDKKNDTKFEVPENSKNPYIDINDDFRIICTSNYTKLNEMSPAFLNRFEVIVLEDQLAGLDSEEFKKLIKFELDFFQSEFMENIKYKRKIDEKNEKKSKRHKKKKIEENIENDEEFEKIKKIINNNKVAEKQININDYIGIIYDKIKLLEKKKENDYEDYSKKYLSFSNLAKFCRAICIFFNKFSLKKDISKEEIVNFCFELIFEDEISENCNKINTILINELLEANRQIEKEKYKNEEKYFFQKSNKLKQLMLTLYASSLINQHLCIIGPPGIGKTLGSRAFSLIREKITCRKYESSFYMNTFNEHTRPNDYYGVASLKDDKLIFKDGNLTKCLKQGNIFIADEFNISSEDCMKCISPTLELDYCNNIYIPGIEGKIKIDPDFFLIICQNTKDTFGRKELPEIIKNKIKIIFYPERIQSEIEEICNDMYNDIFSEKTLKIEDIKLCGALLMKINEDPMLTPWSLRDIYKIFKRLYNQYIKKIYKGIELKENILFYIISTIHESSIKDQLPKITKLIQEVFHLEEEEEKKLFELNNSIPIIIKEASNTFLKKYYITISLSNIEEDLLNKINNIPSLLDAYFKILISSDDEPILLSGPTSYKTFLAKLIFRNSKYEVISLNSESSIPQLIGSTILLSIKESKMYYLRLILELLQMNNIDNLLLDIDKKKIKKLIEENSNKEKDEEDSIFNYAIKNFKKKYFNDDINNSLLGMILEFKPGIFISAKIRGHNLILKNITNVKTEYLERLNEVFTGSKKITLNEDVQNSLTPENKKEISFNNDFRVICTCQEGEEAKLSEAFKSRLTVIYINNYSHEEYNKIIRNESEANDIDIINEKIYQYQCKFNYENIINLSRILNCINISKKLDKNYKNSHEKNLKLAIYYKLKGLMENKKKYLKDINNIFSFENKENLLNQPILVESKLDNTEIIESNFSKLYIHKQKMDNHNNKQDIIFTELFNDLLDQIHFGILAKTPIILEGSYGQGKYTAIDYYCRLVGYEMLRIIITKSTKIDDLLYKTVLKNNNGKQTLVSEKTPFCQAIEDKDLSPKTLIIIEGINNASPAILDILDSIFNPINSNILLPNGSTITKGYANIIGIFNPSNDYPRDKLPSSLVNNCLYYIVENNLNNDIELIIEKLFEKENLNNEEAKFFSRNYIISKKIAENDVDELPITLNEIRKYILFRKKIPNLNKNIIISFIFLNHFTKIESINKIRRELNLQDYNLNVEIKYSGNNKYLNLKINEKNLNIKYPIVNHNNINQEENIKLFNSLTESEQYGFLFLFCCLLIRKVPIIQGETASGKSYLMNIFAKIMGEDLIVYQMNENTGLSIFTGQSIINENLNENEKNELNKILNFLNNEKNEVNEYNKEINGEDINNMMDELEQKIEENEENEEEKKKYDNMKNILMKITSPLNRFKHKDSEFINSLKKGKWILLDGIEHCPSLIIEKLSSFCEENRSLNIYEAGSNDLKFESKDIHENCKLFIIYNPLSNNSNKIHISLLYKCIRFNLPSIDNRPRDAAIILFNGFSKLNLIKDVELKCELSNRIISYHNHQIKKTKEKTDLVAGNIPFTSRNLKFISNDYYYTFKNKYNEIYDIKKDNKISIELWLYSIFDNYYWRSFIHYSSDNKKEFENESLELFSKKPEIGYYIKQEIIKEIKFKDITDDIIGIQNYAYNNIYYDFNFTNFIRKCLKLPLNDEILKWIINNIDDTINLLNNNNNLNNLRKSNLYQIYIIKIFLEELIKNSKCIDECISNKELLSDDLLTIKEIRPIILRLKLLYALLKNKNENKITFYSESINYELLNPLCCELIHVLDKLISSPNKNNFIELAKLVFKNPDFFSLLNLLFPFNLIDDKNEKMKCCSQLVYTWINLFKYKNNFSLREKDNKYDIIFNEKQSNEINIYSYFILNEKESIYLSKGSYLSIYDFSIKKDHKVYIKEISKEGTIKILTIIMKSLNEINENMIENYDVYKLNKRFESSKLFLSNSNSVISRMWSIIFCLSTEDKIKEYFKNLFCDLEKDIFQKLLIIYKNIEKTNIEDIIDKMNKINFFCNNNSILWKYHNNNFENLNLSQDEINKELRNLKVEEEKIDNLYDLWSKEEIGKYKSKLNDIHIKLISIKENNKKNKKILELKQKAKELINKLDNNWRIGENMRIYDLKKNKKEINQENKKENDLLNKNIIKQMNYIKEEIIEFMENDHPTLDAFNELDAKVKIFIEVTNKTIKMGIERVYWPTSVIFKKYNLSMNNLQLDELILWYSEIKNYLDIITYKNLSENKFFEYILNLYKYDELESIINFINEKKIITNKSCNFSENDIKLINSMLRSVFLKKIIKMELSIDITNNLKNYMEYLNRDINPLEVNEENYVYVNSIANIYSYDLKIICPSFEYNDIFYLFFKYQNSNILIKNDIIKDLDINDKNINLIASDIFGKINGLSSSQIAEKIILKLYQKVFGKNIENKDDFKYNLELIEEESEKKFTTNMIKYFSFFEELDDIIIKQKNNKVQYNFSDILIFQDILQKSKNHKLIISDILNRGKNNINTLQLYYINEHKELFLDLFNKLIKSPNSIFNDLNSNININYIPFWLYVLRKITSINCIEINDNDKLLRKNLKEQIKNKIKKYLSNNKKIESDWINFMSSNISNELLEPITRDIALFFDTLCKNIEKEFIKAFKNEFIYIFKNLFDNLIEQVFDNKLTKLIRKESIFSDNIIINFIVNPSKYIYLKIKDSITSKIQEDINKEKGFNKEIENFLNNGENIYEKLNRETKKINKSYKKKEYEITMESYHKQIDTKINEILKLINRYNEILKNVYKRDDNFNFCNEQILFNEYKEINNILETLKRINLNEIKNNQDITIYSIPYNLSLLKENQLILFCNKKKIEILENEEMNEIYILSELNNTNFELKKKSINNERSIYIIESDTIDEKITINKILDFNRINKIKIKYNIKINKNIIKNQLLKINKIDEKKIENCTEVLFNKLTWKQLSKEIENLFSNIKEEIKKSYKDMLCSFNYKSIDCLMEKLRFLSENITKIKSNLKPDKDYGEDFTSIIEKYEALLNKLKSSCESFISISKNETYVLFKNISKSDENSIFKDNYSFPLIPEKKILSEIKIDKINLLNDQSCIPIVSLLKEKNRKIIKCSLEEIKIDLGEISLYKYEDKPIIIKLLSFIDEEINVEIIDQDINYNPNGKVLDNNNSLNESIIQNKDNKKYIDTKQKLLPKEDIEIYITIPDIKYEEESSILMKGKLLIETISKDKLSINLNIFMKISPIRIILTSTSKYKLEIDQERKEENNTLNQYYKLLTDELKCGETLEFSIEDYNENSPLNFVVSLNSLENNDSEKPYLHYNCETGKIKVVIPKNNSKYEVTPRINFDLIIYFREHFIIYISVDALIKINFFSIQMYDYFLKKYIEKESFIYLSFSSINILKNEKIPIILNFLLYSLFSYKEKVNISIKSDLPKGIDIEYPKEDIIINEIKIKFQLKLIINYLYLRYENNYKLIFCFKIGVNIIEYIVNIMNYKNISKDFNNKNLKESNENYFVTPFETKPYIYYKYNERILSYPINKKIEIIYILDGQIHFSNSNTNNCKTFTNKNNNKLGEIYLNDNYPFICKYEDDWFPLIYFNKQDIRYINTVQLYTIEFIEKFIKKNGLSKFLNYLYTEEYFSNNFFNSIKNGIFYKYNIYDTRDIISINNQYDKNNFYSEFTKLINDEKIEIILDNFERYIKDHSNNYNDKNFIIDFKTIAAEIYYNPKIIYEIKQLFPEIIRNKFDEKNEYNDFTKDYSTYCFIVNLRELLFEKYRSNGYRLVIYFKKLKNIQKKLLLELYTDKIDDKENESPSIIIKQQKKNDFFKSTKIKSNLINSIEENENKNTKQISLIFLIEGDDSFPIDKEKKINKSINNNNNNELNNTMISEKINIVELPEIYMNEGMNKNINLYSLKTNYDKFIKCARGFPSYLKYILSQSDNKDEKNKAKHYFDMMLTLYSETVKFKNGNSIIKDKIKEYNFSFEETIQILKNAGLELNNIDILQNINFDSKIKSYIIFPDIKEIETKEDIWELNKDFNQEENYYNNISLFNNYKNSINEIGVLKTKKHDDIILNNFNSNEEDNKIIFEYNQKNDFINEEIEGDLLLDELSSNINEDDIISSSEDDKNEKEEEDNFKKDNNFFISSKKIAKDETDKQSATREKFDKLEAQFNEDYAISFIIKKIKNKIDENDLFFEFEKTGKELNGFEPSEDLLNKNINIEGNMPIIDLLEESKFITSRLITSISQFNADQENYEINFKNLEINILFDCTRLISNENRYFNLLLICGLVNCCYSLGIQYSLSLIGDSDFKIKIKSIEEEHSEIALQMLYDCAFIKRKSHNYQHVLNIL